MRNENAERWARASATAGAAVWAVLSALAGMGKAPLGLIELLFMFAPLVIVPLGLELGRRLAPIEAPLHTWAVILQPFAAGLAVASFWLRPSAAAGILTLPWTAVCALVALTGFLSLLLGRDRSLTAFAMNLGRINLALAGVCLLLSRAGMRPLGFQEPIVLLTAIHFHYAGFATAQLAAVIAARVRERSYDSWPLRTLVMFVILLPFLLAAGFVFSPALKLVAALLLSASGGTLAVIQLWLSKDIRSRSAQLFLRTSAMAGLGGLTLAGAYAVGEALGTNWLLISRMAGTHGMLNGLGFVLLGLLGWLIERDTTEEGDSKRTTTRSHGQKAVAVSLPTLIALPL